MLTVSGQSSALSPGHTIHAKVNNHKMKLESPANKSLELKGVFDHFVCCWIVNSYVPGFTKHNKVNLLGNVRMQRLVACPMYTWAAAYRVLLKETEMLRLPHLFQCNCSLWRAACNNDHMRSTSLLFQTTSASQSRAGPYNHIWVLSHGSSKHHSRHLNPCKKNIPDRYNENSRNFESVKVHEDCFVFIFIILYCFGLLWILQTL